MTSPRDVDVEWILARAVELYDEVTKGRNPGVDDDGQPVRPHEDHKVTLKVIELIGKHCKVAAWREHVIQEQLDRADRLERALQRARTHATAHQRLVDHHQQGEDDDRSWI